MMFLCCYTAHIGVILIILARVTFYLHCTVMTYQLAVVVMKGMRLKSLKVKLQVRCQVNPWDDSTVKKGFIHLFFNDIIDQ